LDLEQQRLLVLGTHTLISETQYELKNLKAGTMYTVFVTARNSDGASDPSEAKDIRTKGPAAPVNVALVDKTTN